MFRQFYFIEESKVQNREFYILKGEYFLIQEQEEELFFKRDVCYNETYLKKRGIIWH